MADIPHFDRKMSDAEWLMWRLEKDPHLSSTFANVTVLDKAPDFNRILSRMERATHVFERLRQRVQPVPVNLTAPMWVEDANFDIHYHVRRVALPKPGSMRQLLDLASLIACDPLTSRHHHRRTRICCATSSPAACGCRSVCCARCEICSPTRQASLTPATPRRTPCAAS